MLSSVTFATHILYCRVSDAWREKMFFNAVFCFILTIVTILLVVLVNA